MAAHASPVGHVGRISATGAIRPGRLGEVIVAIRGGAEAFLARDADGGAVPAHAEVVVVAYEPPRTVLVTRMPTAEEPS